MTYACKSMGCNLKLSWRCTTQLRCYFVTTTITLTTSHHKPATHMDISKNLPHQSAYPLVQTGTRRTALPETPFSLSYKLNSAFSQQVYLILPSSLPHGATYLRLPCKSPSNCFTSHTPVAWLQTHSIFRHSSTPTHHNPTFHFHFFTSLVALRAHMNCVSH